MSIMAGVLFGCPTVAYLDAWHCHSHLWVSETTLCQKVEGDTCHSTVSLFLLPNRHVLRLVGPLPIDPSGMSNPTWNCCSGQHGCQVAESQKRLRHGEAAVQEEKNHIRGPQVKNPWFSLSFKILQQHWPNLEASAPTVGNGWTVFRFLVSDFPRIGLIQWCPSGFHYSKISWFYF